MTIETPYNAHFEFSPAGHVALARSCGDGWWEEWVCVCNQDVSFEATLTDGTQASTPTANPVEGGRSAFRSARTHRSGLSASRQAACRAWRSRASMTDRHCFTTSGV